MTASPLPCASVISRNVTAFYTSALLQARTTPRTMSRATQAANSLLSLHVQIKSLALSNDSFVINSCSTGLLMVNPQVSDTFVLPCPSTYMARQPVVVLLSRPLHPFHIRCRLRHSSTGKLQLADAIECVSVWQAFVPLPHENKSCYYFPLGSGCPINGISLFGITAIQNTMSLHLLLIPPQMVSGLCCQLLHAAPHPVILGLAVQYSPYIGAPGSREGQHCHQASQ